MRLHRLLVEGDAQSEVIGTVLMVAITVVVAATIGLFVFGVGQQSEVSPQVSFEFDFGETDVTITHDSGDTVPAADDLTTRVSDGTLDGDDWETVGDVDSGTSVTLTHQTGGTDTAWDGETVRVVWTSGDGESSAVLARESAPEN